jgi:hypothetical protein
MRRLARVQHTEISRRFARQRKNLPRIPDDDAGKDATSPNKPSQTSMCSQPELSPTIIFMVCGSGSLMLASLVQSPRPRQTA